jgi:hypothetical protein
MPVAMTTKNTARKIQSAVLHLSKPIAPLPLENAAYAVVEALETIAQVSPGTCTSPMMRLMVMP